MFVNIPDGYARIAWSKEVSEIMRAIRFVIAIAVLIAGPAFPQGKKIIFVAGPKDHGMVGRHEYPSDLKALAYCLERSSNLKGITTVLHVGTRPTLEELKDAAAVVYHGSGDRTVKERHPLFPPNPNTDGKTFDAETTAYLKGLEGLMRKGLGLVVFHYTTQVANESAQQFWKDWLGGTYLSEPNVRNNPVDQWSITFKNENHPVLRGVKPWSYKEEIFSKFDPATDSRRTDLLFATSATAPAGPRIAAWALQRDDGGRAFMFGGIDWYSNFQIEDHRRFVLNGIIWAGKIEVPDGGVASPAPEALSK